VSVPLDTNSKRLPVRETWQNWNNHCC